MKPHFFLLLLAPFLTLTPQVHAFSWEQNQIRYLAPFDLLLLLDQKFPIPDSPDTMYTLSGCPSLNESTRSLVGDNLPSTGRPLSPQPTPAFVQFYVQCVSWYFDRALWGHEGPQDFRSLSSLPADTLIRFFGESVARYIRQDNQLYWHDLSLQLQSSLLEHVVRQMLGPDEVIADRGFASGVGEIASKIHAELGASNPTLVEACKLIHVQLSLREEFLSY